MPSMAGTPRDIIVVGAGIIGCFTAYLLANQGAKVTILVRDSVASHALAIWGLKGPGIPESLLEFTLWQYRICNYQTLAFDQQAADHAKQSL